MASAIPYAIAALPTIINMLTPQPSMPGSNIGDIGLQDYSGYQQQLLQSGFNPQSGLYDIARSRAMASLNQDLANKGLGFSTTGAQLQASSQAEIANKFLENELQRRIQSFNAATGYDINAARTKLGIGEAKNQEQWNQYNAEMAKRKGNMDNMNQMATLGGGYMQANQMGNQYSALRANQQTNFDRYLATLQGSNTQSPTGGYYSGYYGSPSGPMNTMNIGGSPY